MAEILHDPPRNLQSEINPALALNRLPAGNPGVPLNLSQGRSLAGGGESRRRSRGPGRSWKLCVRILKIQLSCISYFYILLLHYPKYPWKVKVGRWQAEGRAKEEVEVQVRSFVFLKFYWDVPLKFLNFRKRFYLIYFKKLSSFAVSWYWTPLNNFYLNSVGC